MDPSSDNSLGSSWALSTRPAGSPAAANQTAVTGNVPGAPTVGGVTAGNATATISWTAPGSNGGSALTGYQVRLLDANQVLQALWPAGPGTTSLYVTGLTSGTPYRFQVAAINAVGSGAASGVSATVTPLAALPPSRPVIGTAASGAAGGSITATARWTPPASTGGLPVIGYLVVALNMSSSAADAAVLGRSESAVLLPTARSKVFTLSPGNYRFEVTAINATGYGPASARSTNVVAR